MTEALDRPGADPVLTLVADLHDVLSKLQECDLTAVPTETLMALTGELLRARNRGDAAMLHAVHQVDVGGAAVRQGRTSTAAWLRHGLRLHPAEATRLVRTARALHDDPAGPLVPVAGDGIQRPHQELRAAFAAGEVSTEHVQVITTTVQELPAGLGTDTTTEAEAFLLDEARRHDPKALSHLGRHLRHVLDPDAGDTLAEDEERAVARRHLDIREQNDGSSHVKGYLDPELTAQLRAQLGPLAAPRSSSEGTPDMRSVSQRNADALAELLRRYAGADLSPTSHGASATVTVTMTLETLEQRLGSTAAMLDWSGPISAATARRLACDARVIPVVLGSAGEPLDVGRSSYPVTLPIWRALVARDGGCAFHGCGRPPEWTEAHHIVHWEDGGETSVTNCCLLCDHHHRVVHHQGWDVQLVNGVIHVIPPPWIDPDRVPRRNTQRAQLAARFPLTPESPPDPA
jgi:hypothetical protein